MGSDLVEHEVGLALGALDRLPIPRDVRAELEETAWFVVRRER